MPAPIERATRDTHTHTHTRHATRDTRHAPRWARDNTINARHDAPRATIGAMRKNTHTREKTHPHDPKSYSQVIHTRKKLSTSYPQPVENLWKTKSEHLFVERVFAGGGGIAHVEWVRAVFLKKFLMKKCIRFGIAHAHARVRCVRHRARDLSAFRRVCGRLDAFAGGRAISTRAGSTRAFRRVCGRARDFYARAGNSISTRAGALMYRAPVIAHLSQRRRDFFKSLLMSFLIGGWYRARVMFAFFRNAC